VSCVARGFEAVRALVLSKAPLFGDVTFAICDDVRGSIKNVKDRRRAFMHVFHRPQIVCIAKETHRLPEPYVTGLTLHEFGHLIWPKATDAEADQEIFKLFGIVIRYRGPRKLEWVPLNEVEKRIRL